MLIISEFTKCTMQQKKLMQLFPLVSVTPDMINDTSTAEITMAPIVHSG